MLLQFFILVTLYTLQAIHTTVQFTTPCHCKPISVAAVSEIVQN